MKFKSPLYVLLLLVTLCAAEAPNTLIGNVGNGNFSDPFTSAITPDGSKMYVINSSNNTVSIVDIATNQVTGIVSNGNFLGPISIALTPDGTKAYVTNLSNSTVSVIDVTTDTVTGLVLNPNFNLPNDVAFAPDGSKAYVVNIGGTVSIIDPSTDTVIGSVTGVFNTPAHIAFTPDGTKAYVTTPGDDTVTIVNVATDTVSGIVANGNFDIPSMVVVTPNGTRAYVSNTDNSTVSVIDVATDTAIGIITGGTFNTQVGLAVTHDSSFLYISDSTTSRVFFASTATNAVVGAVSEPTVMFNNPTFISITPDDQYAYVSNIDGDTVGIIFLGQNFPAGTRACTRRNVFLTQIEYFNVVTWSAPTAPAFPIVSYSIYRNAALTDLVTTVSASGPLVYIDRDINPNAINTYYIVAVNSLGISSTAAILTAQFCC